MGLERWFGGRRKVEAANNQESAAPSVSEKDPRAELLEGSIKADVRYRFFNRMQTTQIGGDSLTEIADKAGQFVAELEMGPSDSVVKDFSIDIPGHPEIQSFDALMQHGSKVK